MLQTQCEWTDTWNGWTSGRTVHLLYASKSHFTGIKNVIKSDLLHNYEQTNKIVDVYKKVQILPFDFFEKVGPPPAPVDDPDSAVSAVPPVSTETESDAGISESMPRKLGLLGS